ncbi:type IV toxin-antitoxin system AbiEi family antitoxin domain-containing protein [Tomitella gaofuii]|uniref:type IV toxin-antitoxin system AbiEi family antitoxin domain-containing protein n=1 Tax=Tomitella gaofuii TaxID=2760083 RepID=UPI0015FBF66A|nr:type IV toxin-antitoxin system AbiEi family antitoxin domain-containing protein [Tomitella gaofuii]
MGRIEIIDRAAAHELGICDRELQRRCAQGEFERIRPGVYALPDPDIDRGDRHIAAVRAGIRAMTVPAAVSHASAAALHGMDLWDVDLTRVHMTRPGCEGGHVSARRHLHMGPLGPGDITELGGIEVTTAARTVVDVARTADLARAVAVGDSALNKAKTTRDELEAAVDRVRGRKGAGRAAAAVRVMDARSESPGETWSRLQMVACGMPVPELQRVIRRHGVVLGRVDFYFAELGIVGEFDGRIKYLGREAARPRSMSSAQVVYREKVREDALRRCGLVVFRWNWDDLRVTGRLRRLFDDACDIAADMPAPRIDPPRAGDRYRPRASR